VIGDGPQSRPAALFTNPKDTASIRRDPRDARRRKRLAEDFRLRALEVRRTRDLLDVDSERADAEWAASRTAQHQLTESYVAEVAELHAQLRQRRVEHGARGLARLSEMLTGREILIDRIGAAMPPESSLARR
jgi:hypothetical protein